MLSYSEITDLYGTPISKVQAPHVPFKLKTSHVIIGLIVVGLACYGIYKLTQVISQPVALKKENEKKKH